MGQNLYQKVLYEFYKMGDTSQEGIYTFIISLANLSVALTSVKILVQTTRYTNIVIFVSCTIHTKNNVSNNLKRC